MSTFILGGLVSGLLGWLMGFLSVFLILLVLVQRGRGGGLTGALGGPGGQSAFGSKAGDTFTIITIVVASIWGFTCAFAMWKLGTHAPSQIMETSLRGGPGDDAEENPSSGIVIPSKTDLPPGLEGFGEPGSTPSMELKPADAAGGDSEGGDSEGSDSAGGVTESGVTESGDSAGGDDAGGDSPAEDSAGDAASKDTGESADSGEASAGGDN